MKKTYVIPIINNKGGVAKTITAVTTASILAQRGYKTLLIDLDQQANATAVFSAGEDKNTLTIYDIFFENKSIDDVAIETKLKDLSLIPSSVRFISASTRIAVDTIPGRDNILKRAISNSKVKYDFIIIDCPPSLDKIITNAIMPATSIVITTSPSKFSIEGIKGIMTFILNHKPYMENYKDFGVLITRYNKRRNIVDGIVKQLKTFNHLNIFNSLITESIAVEEATYTGTTINHYKAKSQAAIAYGNFVDELLDGYTDL